MTRFDKPARSVDDQLTLLRERGLLIPDTERARHYLANISYYRLSAYMRPFYVPQSGQHRFLEGTTFEQVLQSYVFDRELRLLLLDAIERLEVSLRAQMTNTLAEHHQPHGYLEPSVFDSRYQHHWLLDKLAKAMTHDDPEPFIQHYRQKYTAPPVEPPVWMAMELLTFKEVSKLFSSLRHREDTQRICAHFGWPDALLHSWFRSLSDLRNLCAHHARVFNREFGSFPKIPRKPPANWVQIPAAIPSGSRLHQEQRIEPQRRLYMQVVVIETLMRIACPESRWAERLLQLLASNPQISRAHMGFPEDWMRQPFWQAVVTKQQGAME